jgi:hypothetical protein
LVAEDELEIRVGHFFGRRRDRRRVIAARRVADGWLDSSGIERTAVELQDRYVLVPATDGEHSANAR